MTQWQPINTAPKDGTVVVLFERCGEPFTARYRGKWLPITYHLEADGSWWDAPFIRSNFNPAHITHWMPLPPPFEQEPIP